MKKEFFVATALLAGSVVFAQQTKKAPPPPPPPPTVEAKEIPPPPPPPPPSPETPPKLLMTPDYAAFLKRNQQVKRVEWKEDEKVAIHLKSGKTETYDLKQKEEVKKLEAKYGQLPEGPPPPPPMVEPLEKKSRQ